MNLSATNSVNSLLLTVLFVTTRTKLARIVARLDIASTIAPNSATSLPISSVVSVAMLVTWLEIAPIDSGVRIGATMPQVLPQAGLRRVALVEEMPSIASTSNLCKNCLVALRLARLLNVSKPDPVLTKTAMAMTMVTETATAISSPGSAALQVQRHLGLAVVMEVVVTFHLAMVVLPLLGLLVALHVVAIAMDMDNRTAEAMALPLLLQVPPVELLHGSSRHPHLHRVVHQATVAMEDTPAMATRPVLIHLLQAWELLLGLVALVASVLPLVWVLSSRATVPLEVRLRHLLPAISLLRHQATSPHHLHLLVPKRLCA